jgi:hypothetical protein
MSQFSSAIASAIREYAWVIVLSLPGSIPRFWLMNCFHVPMKFGM